MLRISLISILLLLASVSVNAQSEPEYRAEIGGGLGMTAYQGDFNGSLTKNMQPMFSLVARYKWNPRMAMAFNVGFGKLKGSSADAETWYPDFQAETYEFSNTMVDAGLRFEYNFWPYGTGREYFGAKPLTPYITFGLGMTYADADGSAFAATLPIGVGVKYKVASRVNLGLEWTMQFTGSDKLDGVEDPYGIKSSGIFKNTDCYSHLRLSVTYDLWAKCRTCHNDDY